MACRSYSFLHRDQLRQISEKTQHQNFPQACHLHSGYMPYMAYSHYCVKLSLWLTATMTQPQDKFIARLPDGLRERLKTAASRNKRSMNAELVHALELHLTTEEYNVDLEAATEVWLNDPNYKADEFPELSSSMMPATKGDLERFIITLREELAKTK